MPRRLFVLALALPALAACGGGRRAEAGKPAAPAGAATVEVVDDYHGTPVRDPYRWLEDESSPETRAWIEAEAGKTARYLERIPGRDRIRGRLRDLWAFERYGIPVEEGGRYFFGRNDGLQNQSVLCVAETIDAEPRVLLDPNVLAEDGTISLNGRWPSPDGRLLAYALSHAGSDWREIRIRDVASGEDLAPDHLRWIKFSGVSWTLDGRGFYYTRLPEPAPGTEMKALNEQPEIRHHAVGTPQEEDRLVYARPDQPRWGLYPGVTDDGRYLVIFVSDHETPHNGIFVKDLETDGPVVELLKEFDADYWPIGNDGSVFWFVTDLDAPMRRIVAVDLRDPRRDAWREVVPEARYAIEDALVAGDRFVVHYLRRAQSRLELLHLDGKPDRTVPLPRPGSVSFARDGGARRNDRELFLAFQGFVDPPTIFRWDFDGQELSVFQRAKVACDPERFLTTQVAYRSRDGTPVTMFLVHKRSLEKRRRKEHDLPTLLYGYGGFNQAQTPWFGIEQLVWLELGGLVAVPNLRGGGEYGEEWHRAGMRERKQNVFDDFMAAAEALVDNGYTQPRRLAIHGASNGGLLVGACLTQRPELFGACIAETGVMDMLRYHRFTVGYRWVPEYGSSEDPEMFKVLHAYSPYHNLEPGTRYPATLILTADHDDRVVPLHSFKFAARMQACQAGDAPVLIRIETRAGHGAGTPTAKAIEEAADRLAFLTEALDMDVSRRFWRKD